MDASQKTLRVSTLPMNYIVGLDSDANGRTRLTGITGDLMEIVLDALGKNFEVLQPEDREFGNIQPGGNFSGMIGMVQKGEADLAFGLLRMSSERLKAVDFSRSYAMESMKFVSKKPGSITPIFAFLYPFDIRIWVGIVISLLIISILGKVLDSSSTLGHNFMKTYSSVLKQPLKMGNGSLKWQFLIGFWCFFTLVISSCYSSALLSFLTVPLQGMSLENFHQLSRAVQAGTHKCFLLKGSFQAHGLRGSNDDNKVLAETIDRNNWYYRFSDVGSDTFIDSNSVVVNGRLISKLFYGFRKDKYLISKDVLSVTPVGIVLSKKFCCTAKLNGILARIEGSGIYNKLLQDASLKMSLSKVDEAEEDPIKPLTVRDLLGCLMILVVGWTLSAVVFVGEIMVFAVKKEKDCKIKKV